MILKVSCVDCDLELLRVQKPVIDQETIDLWLEACDCELQHSNKSYIVEEEFVAIVQPRFMDKVLSWFTA
jgi:hypothetical protein